MGGAVECPICGAGEETVAHFVTECEALDGVRRRFGVGRGDPLEEVLLFGGERGRRWRGPRRCWRRCMEQEGRR